MNGTIYDFRALPLLGLDGPLTRAQPAVERRDLAVRSPGIVGLVSNPRSRLNRKRAAQPSKPLPTGVMAASPATRLELRAVLADFARQGIELLVIDGGDGTIRDVLTCAGEAFGNRWPRIAVLPAGKTNALATDLGVPRGWTLEDALAAFHDGGIVRRAPLEVERSEGGQPPVRGFILGAGAFVSATELAQQTHQAGAFNGIAVALTLGLGVAQTLFGGVDSIWRRGTRMRLGYGPGSVGLHGPAPSGERNRYILLASTLRRLPAGLKPFGAPRPGLKTLVVDAPPRRLAATLPFLLAGSESPWLDAIGYRRADADMVTLDLESSFVLDGELFPAGHYVMRRAAPLRFVVP